LALGPEPYLSAKDTPYIMVACGPAGSVKLKRKDAASRGSLPPVAVCSCKNSSINQRRAAPSLYPVGGGAKNWAMEVPVLFTLVSSTSSSVLSAGLSLN